MIRRTLAVFALALGLVASLAIPSSAAITPILTNLRTSNHNLSYKTVSGVLSSVAPGGQVRGRSFYASCSGVTVVAIDGGPPVTVAPCTWRTMVDGHGYAVKTTF